MSLVRATRVHGEILAGPGLQFFPSEAEFEAERIALLQDRASDKWVSQVGISASAFIPYVGPVIAAGLKAAQSKVDREIEEESAILAAEISARELAAAAAVATVSPQRSTGMFEDIGSWNWSNIATTAVNAFAEYQRSRQQIAPMAMPGGMPTMAAAIALPGLSALPALGGMMSRALPAVLGGAVGGAIVRGGRMIATAIGNISRKRVVAIAKTLGIQAAATALGIGAVEVAQMVLDEQGRKRRGGGVTGAQLRTTRKTMRKVMGMARTIRSACSETGFLARRSSGRKAPYCPPPRVIVTKR